MSLPKIFDLSILTQSKDGKETQGKLYNYFWKRYDFRGGRTLNQVQEEHPYCKDPLKSMSKFTKYYQKVSDLGFDFFRPDFPLVSLGRHIFLLQ